MRLLRPSLAVAALPLAFAAGVLVTRARVRVAVIDHVTTRRVAGAADSGKLIDGYGSGQDDDLDGDGELDCWAMWWQEGSCCSGGVLEVRPSCGDTSWRLDDSGSRYDHLQTAIVPRAAGPKAPPLLAKALFGDLPIGAPDSLTQWLLASQIEAPDPWEPAKGDFGDAVDGVAIPPSDGAPMSLAQVALLTPDEARADGIDPGDGIAVLVAHADGGDQPVPVAGCGVTQAGEHLAWHGHWILATEGEYRIDEVACVGASIVLVLEGERVIAIDAAHGRRATLAGVQYFSIDDGEAELWQDDEHELTLTAAQIEARLAGAANGGFERLAQATARDLHADMVAWGTARLGDNDAPHRFAVIRADHGTTGGYLIEDAPGVDWLVAFDDDGHTDAWRTPPAPIVRDLRWRTFADRTILHTAGHAHGSEVTRFALRDGVPTVLSYTYVGDTRDGDVTRLGVGSFGRIDDGDAQFQVRGPASSADELTRGLLQ